MLSVRSMRSAPVPILLAAVLLPASTADAGTTARIISPVGLVVYDSAVGAGGNGPGRTAVLMAGYKETGTQPSHRVLARVGSIRTLGKVQQLSSQPAEDLHIAVGEDGTVAATWLEGTRGLRFAIARPGKRFSPVQNMKASHRVVISGVAVTPSGRAAVTWRDGASVSVSIAEPKKKFAKPVTLGSSPQYRPAVTVAPDGTAVVAWIDSPTAPDPNRPLGAMIMAATLPASTKVFDAPTMLSSTAYWGSTSFAVGSGPGGAALAWTQDGELRVSRLTPTGFTTPVGTPVRSSTDNGFAVATEPDGSVPTLWNTQTLGDDDETPVSGVMHTSTLLPAGTFSTPVDVSRTGWIPGPPSVVTLSDRTLSVWGSTKGNRGDVVVNVRAFGGPWTSVAASGAADFRGAVQVAASKRHAAFAWTRTVSPSGRKSPLYLWTYDARVEPKPAL